MLNKRAGSESPLLCYLRDPASPALALPESLGVTVFESEDSVEDFQLLRANIILGPLNLAKRLHRVARGVPMILYAARPAMEEHWDTVEYLGLDSVLDPGLFADQDLMAFVISSLLGRTEAKEPCSSSAIRRILQLRDADSMRLIVEQFLETLETIGIGERRRLAQCLVVKELLVNTLRHAFEGFSYDPEHFKLSEEHQVFLNFAVAPESTRIDVSDSAGRLKPSRLLQVLGRQFSEERLLDVSGRGLFLAFSIGNLLYLDSAPGHHTKLTVFFKNALGDEVSGLSVRRR